MRSGSSRSWASSRDVAIRPTSAVRDEICPFGRVRRCRSQLPCLPRLSARGVPARRRCSVEQEHERSDRRRGIGGEKKARVPTVLRMEPCSHLSVVFRQHERHPDAIVFLNHRRRDIRTEIRARKPFCSQHAQQRNERYDDQRHRDRENRPRELRSISVRRKQPQRARRARDDAQENGCLRLDVRRPGYDAVEAGLRLRKKDRRRLDRARPYRDDARRDSPDFAITALTLRRGRDFIVRVHAASMTWPRCRIVASVLP